MYVPSRLRHIIERCPPQSLLCDTEFITVVDEGRVGVVSRFHSHSTSDLSIELEKT